ncbi:TadE family protein [Cellulomonas sp. P5_C5]
MSSTENERERGSMAVEIVVLVPVLLAMIFLIVAFGRYVAAEGDTEAMARDAVRAATLERDRDSAVDAARAVAASAVPSTMNCRPAELRGVFANGEMLTVDVDCTISWSELGFIGLPGTARVEASSSAPLDEYRRTGG